MKTQLYLFIALVTVLYSTNLHAQQIPNKTTLATFDFSLNPAMTAIGNRLEAGIYYRQQWLGFENAPNTGVAYFQYPFVDQNMSAGVYISHDEINLLDANEIAFTYSYKMKIGLFREDQLSLGFSTNVKQIGFDGTNAITSSNNDLSLVRENTSVTDGNFGAGFFYTSNDNIYENDDNSFFRFWS